MKKNLKRFLTSALAALMVFSAAMPVLAEETPGQSTDSDGSPREELNVVERISGKNRYKTAVEVSKKTYDSAEVVVVASGEIAADALVAGSLAVSEDAPVLLSLPSKLLPEVRDEIERLDPETIYIVGGEKTLSKDVENDLRGMADVERVSGNNRYQTSIKIAEKIGTDNGYAFAAGADDKSADALAGSVLAAEKDMPIILTDGKSLPEGVESGKEAIIFGGENTIEVPGYENATRYGGENRFETSLLIAKAFGDVENVVVANGYKFPDSLSSVPFAEENNAPILLVNIDLASRDILNFIKEQDEDVYIIGGEESVSDRVFNDVKRQVVENLVVLHVNDVHGYVEADDTHIGYPNFYNVIQEVKKYNENVLVVDSGDASQGSNFASLTEGADVIKVLNMIGLDAFAPGNHEFDFSFESAMKNKENSEFPWYASNIFYEEDDSLVFEGGEVIDLGDLKVGIFGMLTSETKTKADPRNTQGLYFKESLEENVQIAQEEVDRLRADGADTIIMLSHLGSDGESEIKSIDMGEKVVGIDLIVDGHSHTRREVGAELKNSYIVSAGSELKDIGLATIYLDGDVDGRLIEKAEAVQYGENEEILKLISTILEEQEVVLGQVVGKSKTKLDGERADVRTGETNLGNLITDAMKEKSGADVVLTNGGGIRASIEAGDITKGDVFKVLPFGNTMTVIEVTGQDIVDAIKFGTDAYPHAAGKFPHVSGISFSIRAGEMITPAEGENPAEYQDPIVTDIRINGEEVDLEKTYTLATNDFMAVGGDGYEMFTGKNQVALYDSLALVVEEYIENLSEEAGPEGFEYNLDNRVNLLEEGQVLASAA